MSAFKNLINLVINRTVNKIYTLITPEDVYENVGKGVDLDELAARVDMELLAEKIDMDEVCEKIDMDYMAKQIGENIFDDYEKRAALAKEIDLSELAGNFDLDDLAEHLSIDYDKMSNMLDAEEVGKAIDVDMDDVAERIAEHLTDQQISTLGRYLDLSSLSDTAPLVESIVEQLELGDFSKKVAEQTFEKCREEVLNHVHTEALVEELTRGPGGFRADVRRVVEEEVAKTLNSGTKPEERTLTEAAFKDSGLLNTLLDRAVDKLLSLAEEAVKEGTVK